MNYKSAETTSSLKVMQPWNQKHSTAGRVFVDLGLISSSLYGPLQPGVGDLCSVGSSEQRARSKS